MPLLPKRLSGARAHSLIILPYTRAPGDNARQGILVVLQRAGSVVLPGEDHGMADNFPHLERVREEPAALAILINVDGAQEALGFAYRCIACLGRGGTPDGPRGCGAIFEIAVLPYRSSVRSG